jgi:integrase
MAVRKTAAGTFEVDIRDQFGKKRLRTFKLEREAKAYEHEALAKIGKGEYVAPGRKTVGEAAQAWLDDKLSQDYRRSTQTLWKNHVKNYLIPDLGHLKLTDLQIETVEERLAEWGKRIAPITANAIKGTLSGVLDLAERRGWVSRNVAIRAKGLRIATEEGGLAVQRDKVYDRAELLRLITASDGMTRALIMLLAFTGLRIGEALALAWDQVDLKAAKLDVMWTLADPDAGEEPFFQPPKNKSSKRSLPLPPQLVKELTAWKLRCPISERRLVFAREDGLPYRRARVIELLDRAIEKAQVKRLTPHGLRHTFASMLLAARTPITEVSHLLGHKNSHVTLSVYAHFVPKESTATHELAALVMGE